MVELSTDINKVKRKDRQKHEQKSTLDHIILFSSIVDLQRSQKALLQSSITAIFVGTLISFFSFHCSISVIYLFFKNTLKNTKSYLLITIRQTKENQEWSHVMMVV